MEAKEVARQLVEKYFDEVVGDCDLSWSRAKRCALISVDEILNVVSTVRAEQFWTQVKQEIERL